MRAAHDLSGKEYSWAGHLSDLGIKRYRLKMSIDATGDDWKRLSIYAELMAAIEKPPKPRQNNFFALAREKCIDQSEAKPSFTNSFGTLIGNQNEIK